MKVINKNPTDRQVECDCGALLEYICEDILTGEFGCAYIVCPECGSKVFLDDEDGKTITVDNIEFPKDFAYPGGVDAADEEVNNWIEKCLGSLEKEDKNWGVWATAGSGNTMVFVEKYEDEYAVYVTRNYYQTSIPRNRSIKQNDCAITASGNADCAMTQGSYAKPQVDYAKEESSECGFNGCVSYMRFDGQTGTLAFTNGILTEVYK